MKKYHKVFHSPITELITEGRLLRGQRSVISPAAESGFWLGLTVSPLKDSAEKKHRPILVFTDLTELKAFQSQMELRERLSTLGEMSAGIAHELLTRWQLYQVIQRCFSGKWMNR